MKDGTYYSLLLQKRPFKNSGVGRLAESLHDQSTMAYSLKHVFEIFGDTRSGIVMNLESLKAATMKSLVFTSG